MAYSNTWDETAPVDTSLASLLGQDIRTFKLDIRQRLSGISGTLANRPTPEAVFAGLLYFATDTGHIFSWSGTAWTDVTSIFIPAVTAPSGPGSLIDYLSTAGVGDGTAVQVLVNTPVPILTAGHGVRITFAMNTIVTSAPGTNTSISFYYGNSSQPIAGFVAVQGVIIHGQVMFSNVTGSTGSQWSIIQAVGMSGSTTYDSVVTGVAYPSSTASNILLAANSMATNMEFDIYVWAVELI